MISSLQPWQFDSKTTLEKKATLMKVRFLQVDSKLKVYQES